MATQTLAPFFQGTAGPLTFYKRHGKYFSRGKSSLTAERVKTDVCFEPTMKQANIMAHASRIGSVVYAAIPAAYRQHSMYRTITGQANVRIKQSIADEIIVAQLLEEFVKPVIQRAQEDAAHGVQPPPKPRRKRVRSKKPHYIRKYRRLKMIGEIPDDGKKRKYTRRMKSLFDAIEGAASPADASALFIPPSELAKALKSKYF